MQKRTLLFYNIVIHLLEEGNQIILIEFKHSVNVCINYEFGKETAGFVFLVYWAILDEYFNIR